MATLTEIREGLAANLSGVTGLAENAYLLSNPIPPAAEIGEFRWSIESFSPERKRSDDPSPTIVNGSGSTS